MDFMQRVNKTQQGDTGFNAVNNLTGAGTSLPMPPEIMKHIAAMRMLQDKGLNPQDAMKAEASSGLSGSSVNGLTPQALTALQAIMSRRVGASSNPGADSLVKNAVDVSYNPQ